jgi:hypothetical protein
MLLHRITRPTSAPFQVEHQPLSGQLYGTDRWRSAVMSQVSCCLSTADIRFLGLPSPAAGFAFLTVGLPGADTHPDLIGIVTLHTGETRPGRTPPIPRDGGVPPAN